jgi:hypothetical protein
MIRLEAEIGKEQPLATGMVAASVRLNGHEDGVDVGEEFGIIALKHPMLFCRIIRVQDPEVYGMSGVLALPSPSLKGGGFADAGLLIEIVSIKDQRFTLRVEDTPEGPLGLAVLRHVRKLP